MLAIYTPLCALITILVTLAIEGARQRYHGGRPLPRISDGGAFDPERLLFAFGWLLTSSLFTITAVTQWFVLKAKFAAVFTRARWVDLCLTAASKLAIPASSGPESNSAIASSERKGKNQPAPSGARPAESVSSPAHPEATGTQAEKPRSISIDIDELDSGFPTTPGGGVSAALFRTDHKAHAVNHFLSPASSQATAIASAPAPAAITVTPAHTADVSKQSSVQSVELQEVKVALSDNSTVAPASFAQLEPPSSPTATALFRTDSKQHCATMFFDPSLLPVEVTDAPGLNKPPTPLGHNGTKNPSVRRGETAEAIDWDQKTWRMNIAINLSLVFAFIAGLALSGFAVISVSYDEATHNGFLYTFFLSIGFWIATITSIQWYLLKETEFWSHKFSGLPAHWVKVIVMGTDNITGFSTASNFFATFFSLYVSDDCFSLGKSPRNISHHLMKELKPSTHLHHRGTTHPHSPKPPNRPPQHSPSAHATPSVAPAREISLWLRVSTGFWHDPAVARTLLWVKSVLTAALFTCFFLLMAFVGVSESGSDDAKSAAADARCVLEYLIFAFFSVHMVLLAANLHDIYSHVKLQ